MTLNINEMTNQTMKQFIVNWTDDDEKKYQTLINSTDEESVENEFYEGYGDKFADYGEIISIHEFSERK